MARHFPSRCSSPTWPFLESGREPILCDSKITFQTWGRNTVHLQGNPQQIGKRVFRKYCRQRSICAWGGQYAATMPRANGSSIPRWTTIRSKWRMRKGATLGPIQNTGEHRQRLDIQGVRFALVRRTPWVLSSCFVANTCRERCHR